MTTTNQTSAVETGRPVGNMAAKLVAFWIVLPVFFLITGGSLHWWAAWAYSAVLLVPMTVFFIYMSREDPQFLARRLKVKEKEDAQKKVQKWGALLFLAALLLPGIDHRLGWSRPPLAAVVAALVISLASYLAILKVFLENRWAGRTVEIFAEQKVISTGPYAIVRHPMYSGTIALYAATPVALGSWWGLIPLVPLIFIFVYRILNEEELLARELPGYEDYRKKVRYRLIPFLW